VSGVPSDRIQLVLERDWAHLVRDKGVLDSASYLREKGKPVIALWGTFKLFLFRLSMCAPEIFTC
jgi:hypothetical protein